MTCDITTDEYRGRVQALFPPGPAWEAPAGTELHALQSGIAQEFSVVHNRGCTLAREMNPASTVEMLLDWERVVGPDLCRQDGATMAERRAAVVAKLAATGGQSRAYYTALAASFGYTITIVEYRPFRAGRSAAGDALTNDGDGDPTDETAWTHWWTVQTQGGSVTYFSAGIGAAGEPLARFGDDLLECIINRYKPAHTNVIFQYL